MTRGNGNTKQELLDGLRWVVLPLYDGYIVWTADSDPIRARQVTP